MRCLPSALKHLAVTLQGTAPTDGAICKYIKLNEIVLVGGQPTYKLYAVCVCCSCMHRFNF